MAGVLPAALTSEAVSVVPGPSVAHRGCRRSTLARAVLALGGRAGPRSMVLGPCEAVSLEVSGGGAACSPAANGAY